MSKQQSRRDVLLGVTAGLAAWHANAAGTSERIRITKVELFQVVVPMQPDIISSPELGPDTLSEFPTIPKFIVKIQWSSNAEWNNSSRPALPNCRSCNCRAPPLPDED